MTTKKKHLLFGKIDFGNEYEALKKKKTIVVIGYNDNIKIPKEEFFTKWENAYKQAITLNN